MKQLNVLQEGLFPTIFPLNLQLFLRVSPFDTSGLFHTSLHPSSPRLKLYEKSGTCYDKKDTSQVYTTTFLARYLFEFGPGA